MKALHSGDSPSPAHIARITNGLRDRTLPKEEWTHAAHLVAGASLHDELGLTGAEAAMPDIIRAYNLATGTPNTDSEGYHHTITLVYLRLIDRFMAGCAAEPLHERTMKLLASPLAEKDYPLSFYTHERLFSVKARREWVDPDLKTLD